MLKKLKGNKTRLVSVALLLLTALATPFFVSGCGNRGLGTGLDEAENSDFKIDESAFARAKEILAQYPEVETEPTDQPEAINDEVVTGDESELIETEDFDDSVTHEIPEREAAELMQFVDQATLDVLQDTSYEQAPSAPTSEQRLNKQETTGPAQGSQVNKDQVNKDQANKEKPKGDPSKNEQKPPPAVPRRCEGDRINPKTKAYHESIKDECLLPKVKAASELFKIRYYFARCIFHRENPRRDRLAHNMNGNGLAQIVNMTMREVNARWKRGDSVTGALKQCLQKTSNRKDEYLNAIDSLIVPAAYNKSDILHEASTRPASTRLNPLYRDDGVCMGLMTMAIKVQEAKGRSQNRTVSDHELARRYNGSRLQQRYARAVVKCIDDFKRGISLPKF